ncbi:class I SAM-dependent methyltransferase [Pseudomonas prosekii]|uniref:class I SAM-dependent methyltransferase n=1 Tax=Pseudomonas prosekii TaxID=1148509 RepID=UPI003F751759
MNKPRIESTTTFTTAACESRDVILSSTERFLSDFHDLRPGITSNAFQALPAIKGGNNAASSYEFLAEIVPRVSTPLTVLDIACGDGYLLELIHLSRSKTATLIGVDISAGELAAAELRIGKNATLISERGQEMSMSTDSVDIVLCHMALMLMDDLEVVIAEIRRVLKPGGTFSFIVGAKPERSIALDLYIQILRRARNDLNSTIPRFGDERLADDAKIERLLSVHFGNVLIEIISISRRYSPLDMCRWFESMYDLHGIPHDIQESMKREYVNALTTKCDSDGFVAFTDALRQVTATAF